MSLQCVFKRLLAMTLLASAPLYGIAETLWLSDVLWVNVRTGPGADYRSLKTITSGTRMDVLEEQADSDFIRVRTENGLEGWIPRRYTFDEPTGRIQAEIVTAEKLQLQQQFDALDKKYKALLTDKGDVNGELESLRTNNETLSTELNRIKAVSENAINLDSQFQDLAEENARVKNEMDVLKAENTSLKEYNDTQMLYVGGILIIIGIMLGAVLPRLTGRKRKDGW